LPWVCEGAAILEVTPVIDYPVRGLCVLPYGGDHPRGCPNFGKCDMCPPCAPKFDVVYHSTKCFAVVNEFDLAAHREKMRAAHPAWSERQLVNCLYWQGTARKKLRELVRAFLLEHPDYRAEETPEAMGVNVTATLRAVGIELEWPPVQIVRQVALCAVPLT